MEREITIIVKYDSEADALYIPISAETVTRTEDIGDDINVDFGGEKVVGIEITNVSIHAPSLIGE